MHLEYGELILLLKALKKLKEIESNYEYDILIIMLELELNDRQVTDREIKNELEKKDIIIGEKIS